MTGPRACGSSSARSGPHPGAQLRFTDIDGHRFTAFATDARKGQLADLELRHRRRARCEDRIRNAKDTGLRNLPLKGFAQNQVWCEIVALACELLAWTQMLALAGAARRWEPKRLRLRLFSAAGRLARGGRRLRLRLAERWPWAGRDHRRGSPACRPSHPADQPEPSLRHERSNPGARGTPPTRRDSRAARHGPHPKITTSRTTQASTSATRKIEASMITPIKKPTYRDLLDWEKEFNTQINSIRYVIEQTIANFKTSRIMYTDYRRPPATFTTTISAVIALHFYAAS